jgi:hypothetical protein
MTKQEAMQYQSAFLEDIQEPDRMKSGKLTER